MQTHTKELIEELTDLKDTYKGQSESFVGELRKLEERQIRDFDLITRTTNGLTNLTNEHGFRLNLHDSQLSELFGRMKLAEKEIENLRAVTTHLDTIKTNRVEFIKSKKKLELKNLQQDVKLFKCSNHCLTLDNYQDKYAPIRIQGMINETLRSILGGKERRRLELYDNEKNSILYQALLVDDGTGNIAQLMAELHEAASREIEEEEKKKKRRAAISEASKSEAKIDGSQVGGG